MFDCKKAWTKQRFQWARQVRRDSDLSDGAKLLAWTLCEEFFNRSSGQCNPPVRIIAEAMGVKLRCAQKRISELRNSGWLKTMCRDGRRQSNNYHFVLRGECPLENRQPMYARSCTSNAPLVTHDRAPTYAQSFTPLKETKSKPSHEPDWHDGRLQFVESGEPNEKRWRAWMTREGFEQFESLDLVHEGRELIVPMVIPPSNEETVKMSLAMKWFKRRKASLMNSTQAIVEE